jgi:hypothetical protein
MLGPGIYIGKFCEVSDQCEICVWGRMALVDTKVEVKY